MAIETAALASGGIYAITNTITGEQYVGSALYFADRWSAHRVSLRRGLGASRLQAAWDTYGESAFTFRVLEEVGDRRLLLDCEQDWIDRLQPAYNGAARAVRVSGERQVVSGQVCELGVRLPYLQAWRQRRLVTRKELADAAQVSRSTVASSERGARISGSTAEAIASALGVSVEQLQRTPDDSEDARA